MNEKNIKKGNGEGQGKAQKIKAVKEKEGRERGNTLENILYSLNILETIFNFNKNIFFYYFSKSKYNFKNPKSLEFCQGIDCFIKTNKRFPIFIRLNLIIFRNR